MTSPSKDNVTKYKVVIDGVVLPEKSRAEVIEQLAALFHSKRDTMEQLLQGKSVSLTREYSHEQAEKICQAIREAGAECRMQEIGAVQEPSVVDDLANEFKDDSAQQETEAGDSSADAQVDGQVDGQVDDEVDDNVDDQVDGHVNDQPDDPQSDLKSALMRFVDVNTDYYARQFAKFGAIARPSFAITWHWPAFFAFFFWAMYRKMWLWAGVNMAGGVVLALLFEPGIIYLAWAFLWPLVTNYLYFRHARNRVFNATSNDERANLDSRGGVSWGAVWLGLVVVFLLSMALNDLISQRMLERYSDRINQIVPAPGTQQRGDGSVIDDLTMFEPGTADTVKKLGVLAATLKLAASGKGAEDSQLALSVFERIIEQKKIDDAWGNKIALRRDASGQVVLISAGPDGRFNSEDDILQYIQIAPAM